MLLEITWYTDQYGRLAARWRDGLERWINDGLDAPHSQGIDGDKIAGREVLDANQRAQDPASP